MSYRFFYALYCVAAASFAQAGEVQQALASQSLVLGAFKNIRAKFILVTERSELFYAPGDEKAKEDNPPYDKRSGDFLQMGEKILTRTVRHITLPEGGQADKVQTAVADGEKGSTAESYWVNGQKMTSQVFANSGYSGIDFSMWCYGIYLKPIAQIIEDSNSTKTLAGTSLELSGTINSLGYKARVDTEKSFTVRDLELPSQGATTFRRVSIPTLFHLGSIWVPQDYIYEVYSTESGKAELKIRQSYHFYDWQIGKNSPSDLRLPSEAGTFIKQGENGPVVQVNRDGSLRQVSQAKLPPVKMVGIWLFVGSFSLLSVSIISWAITRSRAKQA